MKYGIDKILVVEDDDGLRMLIQSKLAKDNIKVDGVKFGKDAIKWIEENKSALLILDYKLPDMKASEIIETLKSKSIDINCIIITGHGDVKIAVELMKLGVKDYLIKDLDFLDLLPAVVDRVSEEIKKEQKLKEAEEALYRSEESYKILSESLIDVIWMTDIDLNLLYISNSVTSLLGYMPEELLNERVDKMFTLDSGKALRFYYENAIKELKNLKNIRESKNAHFNNAILELEQVHKEGFKVWTEVRVSFMYDSKNNLTGISGVTRDITGRKEALRALSESFKTLTKALEASIEAMGKTTEIRDPYTAGHQKRVGILAYEIAKMMNLTNDQKEGVRLAGAIHDIGKIYVPAEILSKPGKISENEFNILKTHSQVGYDILRTIDFPWPIAKIVLQHHERIDGSGYPNGLKGDEILIEAKIIGVADVVEAMASYRPYRPALGIDKALEEILKNKGKIYDPEIVDICQDLIVNKGFQFT
jgi:PAS domain S-box-containing protein/putative nucleotidyltransferase with HDIG domain